MLATSFYYYRLALVLLYPPHHWGVGYHSAEAVSSLCKSQLALFHTHKALVAYDQVIEHFNIQVLARLD